MDEPFEGLRRTGLEREDTLEGSYTVFQGGYPIIVQFQGFAWMLTFTTLDRLQDFCRGRLKLTGLQVKQITDAVGYIKSVRQGGLRVMRNPTFDEARNVTVFDEMLLPEETGDDDGAQYLRVRPAPGGPGAGDRAGP